MKRKNISKEEREKIEQIRDLFEQIDGIYSTLDQSLQDEVLDYHIENCSLPHCIRWGLQAVIDLIGDKDLNFIKIK